MLSLLSSTKKITTINTNMRKTTNINHWSVSVIASNALDGGLKSINNSTPCINTAQIGRLISAHAFPKIRHAGHCSVLLNWTSILQGRKR